MAERMSDVPKVDLRKACRWLPCEVEIRLPRGWLVVWMALPRASRRLHAAESIGPRRPAVARIA